VIWLSCSLHKKCRVSFQYLTKMVQLPATAAIEYVAACCRTRTWTRTKTGTKTKIGTITKTVRGPYARSPKFNTYTHRLGFLCQRDGQTDKKKHTKKRQTQPPISTGSRPPLPKFSGYVEVVAHYIFHRSTVWVLSLCTELWPKNTPKMPILPWSKRIYVALAVT